MTVHEKVKLIARHYGYDTQSRQCIEEMAELTQAINKFWRRQLDYGQKKLPNDDDYMPFMSTEYENMAEELADVKIMVWQMEVLLGIRPNVMHNITEVKLDRQLERIKQEGMPCD